jgi:hypothetical protein
MPPEPQERTRNMESLQMGVRSTTTTEGSDVYEAYVKPKDVKHKWIQTEDFDQGIERIYNFFDSASNFECWNRLEMDMITFLLCT